jgi:hypothetical protein
MQALPRICGAVKMARPEAIPLTEGGSGLLV